MLSTSLYETSNEIGKEKQKILQDTVSTQMNQVSMNQNSRIFSKEFLFGKQESFGIKNKSRKSVLTVLVALIPCKN